MGCVSSSPDHEIRNTYPKNDYSSRPFNPFANLRVNQEIEVMHISNQKYSHAIIIQVKKGYGIKIHWVGWGSNYDEWITESKYSTRINTASLYPNYMRNKYKPANIDCDDLYVNQEIEVYDTSLKKYKAAKIIQVKGGVGVKIHWIGYSDKWDEFINRDQYSSRINKSSLSPNFMKNKYNRGDHKNQLTKSDMEDVGLLVSLLVLEQVNFYLADPVKLATFASHLTSYSCGGSTALRDAVCEGVAKLLKTKAIIPQISDRIDHKFIHIVITDGQDNKSKCSLTDLSALFFMMGAELGDLCKTFFVGISLGDQELKQLQQLALLGGDSCELINEDASKIDDIFDRIAISLGISVQYGLYNSNNANYVSKTEALEMTFKHQKYCVLFTLDTSGSMSGQRWTKLCLAIKLFCSKLKKSDLFGCQLFSDEVRTLKI